MYMSGKTVKITAVYVTADITYQLVLIAGPSYHDQQNDSGLIGISNLHIRL